MAKPKKTRKVNGVSMTYREIARQRKWHEKHNANYREIARQRKK